MGLLEGAFYDSKGRPTKALKQAEEGAILGAKVKELREIEKKKYPNCNSRWSQKKGEHGSTPGNRCSTVMNQDCSV